MGGSEAVEAGGNQYGVKYEGRGMLAGPAAEARVVTVWIILVDEDFPRFVTAYPE